MVRLSFNTILHALIRKKIELRDNNSGVALIEFAFMLPFIVIIALGAVEFGMWFYESEITTSSLGNISQAIQNNPNITATQLQQMVNSANGGLTRLNFTKGGNFICVKAYATAAAAQKGGCKSGDLSAANPSPGNPYAVAIEASVAPNALTPLGKFAKGLLPTGKGMTQITVVTINDLVPPAKCVNTATAWGALQYDPTATPPYSCVYIPFFPPVPVCDKAGEALQFDAKLNKYDCATDTPPPNCHQPWQSLLYDAKTGNWSCPNTPYVFAGGIAHPATTNPSAFWADSSKGTPVRSDSANVPWVIAAFGTSGLNTSLICDKVTFTVPAGLPAGRIIAQGNLIYPGATNDGLWKDWSVSFVKLDTGPAPPTTKAYAGSAYACMDNNGNYTNNNAPGMINSEHVSWTVIFTPN